MTITTYGLSFGTIYIEELQEWFWSVWDNQALELSSPPIFFGFVKTFKDVENHAKEYFLEATAGEGASSSWEDENLVVDYEDNDEMYKTWSSTQSNDYTRSYFEHTMNPRLSPFFSKFKNGKYYFIVVWSSPLSFLKNEDPIYLNKKATTEIYEQCLQDFEIGTAINNQATGSHAKYFARKLAAINNEKYRKKSNDIDLLEFLYTSDLPYDWEKKKNWFRHRIIKKTEKSIFVERLPFTGGRKLPHDWRKNVIFSARLNREKLEDEGVIYSKTFQSWFCTRKRMDEQMERDKKSSKSWDDEIVIEYPEDRISWALQVYGLTTTVSKPELRKLFNIAVKVHHPDVGGKHKDFIRVKEAYDILIKID